MEFNYSRHNLKGKERFLERGLEILPGALSWFIIIGVILLSVFKPLIASVLMIALFLYWILRLLYMNIFLVLSYARLSAEIDTDWMRRIDEIDRMKPQEERPPSGAIYHLVIVPVINEMKDVLEPGILEIKNGKFPAKRILVLIALENRAQEKIQAGVREMQQKYQSDFLDFLVTVHPDDLPGEARVKGANVTYAARRAKEYFDKVNILYENIIVSCFDADTIPQKDYFSCLTYHFLINPRRTKTSYQPIPVYHNNIWDVPAFARVIDIGTSFFELVEATNPAKLVTFSSHSLSFKTLIDVGYWPVDMISDDSAIFWKAFLHYDGNYQTMPMYTTVSMDIVSGRTVFETFRGIYKQKRRWAWGVENFPVVLRAFLTFHRIPLSRKISHGFKLLESFVSWATWSFLLAFGSWLPAFFAGREFSTSTVFYIAPRIRDTIFSLSSLGILLCMLISLQMLPPQRGGQRFFKKIQHAFEWFFIPVVIVFLSALPALDAQTRLLLGKNLEFWAAGKRRGNSGKSAEIS